MRYFLALACIIATASALDKKFVEEFMHELRDVGQACSKEVGATSKDIIDLLSHKIPETDTGKCMIFCIHKHYHIQNEDGSIDKEGALKFLSPMKLADADIHGQLVEVFNGCFDSVAADPNPCITAAGFVECALSEAKAKGIDESILE